MKFDFDRVIDLRNTHSAKWDRMEAGTVWRGKEAPVKSTGSTEALDAIPMWVADMDFNVPPPVTAALQAEVDRSVFGYYDTNQSWREAACAWLERRHGWSPDPDWLSTTPGVVSAIGLILQALSEPGDEVMVFSPAYHAFRYIIEANDRVLRNVPMIVEQGRSRIDMQALADMLTPRGKVVILCSPHNPGGRVWEVDEIRAVAEFCRENDLYLISDEIHCDLVYPEARHVPTALAAPGVMDRLITCVSATKSFNLAGAHVSAAVISNPEIKKKVDARMGASGLMSQNRFGMIATEAAWRGGDAWLDALIPYLQANRDHFASRIARAVPGSRAMHLEATYLGWVDFTGTGLEMEDYMERITQRARIGVSPGPQFGTGGEKWMRFNFAMRRALLDEALDRLETAFSDLG
ncbi:MAG: pyridoxal phosphate-dependent aminotransferase [Salaquimonas sp.]|nr:pyridoxal phosphate-dependent aminotransferase [Salaquimonas sp.]